MSSTSATPSARIGQYRLSKTLGIGSFGKVKLAIHEKTGYKVAIKILNRNKIKKLDMVDKVRREIANLKRFNHPHIIRLYEVIHTLTDIFVVMEFVSGGELFDYIVHKGKLREDDARRFFQQILAGVEYCHHHLVVHRDLKPENLLLDEESNVKIADFGLSNCLEDGLFLRTSCGSPNYAAPEVISGNLYAGPEVDVWSCGVILYALLCGTLPFDDEIISNLFRKIKSGMYVIPSHLSEYSRDLIVRMLNIDPLKRITIPEIRAHPWFRTRLPLYLSIPPAQAESAADAARALREYRRRLAATHGIPYCDSLVLSSVSSLPTMAGATNLDMVSSMSRSDLTGLLQAEHDEDIIASVLALGYPGINAAEDVEAAVRRSGTPGHGWNDVGVAYQLLVERKLARQRSEQIAEAMRTADTPMPSMQGMFLAAANLLSVPGFTAEENAHSAAQAAATAGEKRRRWYLGIQSKKEPSLVMGEVFRALRDAGFEWKTLGPYRIRARYSPTHIAAAIEATIGMGSEPSSTAAPGTHEGGMEEDTTTAAPDSSSGGTGDMEVEEPHGSAAGSAAAAAATAAGGDALEAGSLAAAIAARPRHRSSSSFVAVDESPLAGGLQRLGDVKIGLQLYKVQRGIYLLDLQKLAGDAFSFMNLCARIITELKVPAMAAAAAAAANNAAAAAAALCSPAAAGHTAPALLPAGDNGAVVEVYRTMRLRPDGSPDLYYRNPTTGGFELLPEGLRMQAILHFHQTGQLVGMLPPGAEPASITGVPAASAPGVSPA